MLKFALLGFLNYRPQAGYDLNQTMERSTSHFWHAKLSQIYLTLKALESDGLVVSHLEQQGDRPDRRVYTITEAGRQALHDWLSQPIVEIEPQKNPLLLKLFFSAQIGKDALLVQLHLQRRLHQRQMQVYQQDSLSMIEEIRQIAPHLASDARLWEASRRFGELYEEMTLRWLDETIQRIEKGY